MARLEDLRRGARVRGVLPEGAVAVVDCKWHGPAGLELLYQDETGRPGKALLYRDAEPSMEILVPVVERDFGATSKKRMNILHGITGLWQVSGRSDASSEQRFALALFYIEHWSLGLDLEIIFKTIPAMLFGKGAY